VAGDDKLNLSREDFLTAVDALSISTGDSTDAERVAMSDSETAALYGERIRMAREWKGFTLDELAIKTGLEKAYLEKAEAGEEMLPLGVLVKVAKTLSLRLADVISRGQEPFTVVRSGEGRALHRTGSSDRGFGYRYESLAPNKKGKTMEPFLVTLFPHQSMLTSSHEGQEFLYVLEGEVEVTLEGKKNRLSPGDSIYYDSIDEHLVIAYGDAPAKIVAVLST